jgi:hypothetical protein
VTPAGGGAGTDEVVHRGVRWRRSSTGRMMWFNDGSQRWVLWSPGSDAPPVPVVWEGGADDLGADAGDGAGAIPAGTVPGQAAPERPGLLRYLPSDAMARRPSMRSPYRIVPIIIVVVVIGLAVYQSTRSPNKATTQDIAAAMALKGRCLEKHGGTAQYPDYSPTPLSCSAPKAVVKVVEVVIPSAKAACPTGTLAFRVIGSALAGEPIECLAALPKH